MHLLLLQADSRKAQESIPKRSALQQPGRGLLDSDESLVGEVPRLNRTTAAPESSPDEAPKVDCIPSFAQVEVHHIHHNHILTYGTEFTMQSTFCSGFHIWILQCC